MIDRARFLETFPEFASTPVAIVDRALEEAADLVDPETFGPRIDTAHGLRTADLLASGVYSVDARMVDAKGATVTVYRSQLDRLIGVAAIGLRVF
jgi:hypothetical protein